MWSWCCRFLRYCGFHIDSWISDWSDFPLKKSEIPEDKTLSIWHYKWFREEMPVVKKIKMPGIIEALIIKYDENHQEVYVLYPDLTGEEYSKSLFVQAGHINDNRKHKLAELENQAEVSLLYEKLEEEHIKKQSEFNELDPAIKKIITDNII